MADWPRGHDDFEPGNRVAVRHGGYSPVLVREAAQPIIAELYQIAPWLQAPEFLPSVANYAETLAQATLLTTMVAKITAEKGVEKVPSRTWEQLTAARRLVHHIGNDFGLTPQGRARLAATATAADLGQETLASVIASGRAARLARTDLVDAQPVPDDEIEP